MTYKLAFHPKAAKEWKKLDPQTQAVLKSKLQERLKNPHVPGSRLTGAADLYKIKLKRPPYRLCYHVNDKIVLVTALSIGKRDGDVYENLMDRVKD